MSDEPRATAALKTPDGELEMTIRPATEGASAFEIGKLLSGTGLTTYDPGYGFDLWNKVATIGAFTLAGSVAFFLFNIFYSKAKAKSLPPPGPDPWDARTIEWMIPSPVPAYNFDPMFDQVRVHTPLR